MINQSIAARPRQVEEINKINADSSDLVGCDNHLYQINAREEVCRANNLSEPRNMKLEAIITREEVYGANNLSNPRTLKRLSQGRKYAGPG